jgi:hypothetical protein
MATSDDDELTDAEWEAFLADNPPKLPPFAYTFRGVDDEDIRNALVAAMSPLANFMSRIVPLDGLDGITVAIDYHTALAELDRGIATSDKIEPTVESFGTGVAMSSGVVRDGRFKTHVTFEANIIAGLLSEDAEIKGLSTHTFMHELGHVAEHTLDWERFGDAMLKPFDDKYEFELYRQSHSCWSEYYASRVSASWGADALDGLRELLEGALEQLNTRVTSARGTVGPLGGARNDDAAMEIIGQVAKLMKFAGYVIGHARGAGVDPLEDGSVHRSLLDEVDLSEWFDELTGTLDAIYDSRDQWADLSAFYPLHRAFEAACLAFKLQVHRSDKYDLAWRIWF